LHDTELQKTEGPWLNTISRPLNSEILYVGSIFALRVDQVRMPGGNIATREVVEHYGAWPSSRWTTTTTSSMVYQYRHPWAAAVGAARGLLDSAASRPHSPRPAN
jgi:ADP-ribose pyrophosphatase